MRRRERINRIASIQRRIVDINMALLEYERRRGYLKTKAAMNKETPDMAVSYLNSILWIDQLEFQLRQEMGQLYLRLAALDYKREK